MRINHCGLQIGVSQEFLNCSYIISIFKKMCGKTMAQRMNRCLLSCPCLNYCFLKCPLQRCGVLMMTADDAASRVNRKRFCRKEPKPAPLFPCLRIFFLKGAGQINSIYIVFPVLFIYFSYRRYLVQEFILKTFRKHSSSVLLPFP